ncbi:hypothetical protein ACIQKE_22795 [Streptomyces griseoviridis]|uniref:Uncharacterized protein n=1 Tax=Streptomyces hintoniae TaxID=3075521 RepID=A0ABU2UE72_9ACTN|nr:hypothetical protein [Streptomyces sp. DSM 41014]MDT0471385.1 hypothetical protein [Streptomyces sp. DSM 41014]
MATARNVYVPEGTFGVLDAGEIPVQTADWSNRLAVPMSQGALIVTGIHTGAIRTTATALTGPPAASRDDSWEEIAEVSVRVPTGLLRVESLEQGPADGLALLSPAGPGWYRLRVHARGRNVLPEKASAEPVEDYLLVTWPAPQSDAHIIRSSDRIDHALAHASDRPQPQPPPARGPEQEALRRQLLRG